MIKLKNITKAYGDTVILNKINAVINKGDAIAIIGSSGSGKSTLLQSINVLERPSSGQVIFNKVDLTAPFVDLEKERRKIGMVFQNYNLFEHMTVLENAMRPQMDLLGREKINAYNNAMKYLKLVGMADKLNHYPSQLSGGQKQRAAIARTLSMDPEIILFDEPTSALDPAMVGEVEYVIKKLKDMGKTMVIVTHDMKLAREVSNRVWFLADKKIYEDAPTEELFTNPKKEKTIMFIRNIKRLEFEIKSKNFDYVNAIQKIEQYCDRISLSSALTKKLHLLFEEICIQTLIPSLKANNTIIVSCEYSEEQDKLSMTVKHNGISIFDEDAMDIISRKLIENAMNDIELNEILFK